VIGLIAIAVAVTIYAISRREPVTSTNVNDLPPIGAQRAALNTTA
jgi:hypothetical protein